MARAGPKARPFNWSECAMSREKLDRVIETLANRAAWHKAEIVEVRIFQQLAPRRKTRLLQSIRSWHAKSTQWCTSPCRTAQGPGLPDDILDLPESPSEFRLILPGCCNMVFISDIHVLSAEQRNKTTNTVLRSPVTGIVGKRSVEVHPRSDKQPDKLQGRNLQRSGSG